MVRQRRARHICMRRIVVVRWLLCLPWLPQAARRRHPWYILTSRSGSSRNRLRRMPLRRRRRRQQQVSLQRKPVKRLTARPGQARATQPRHSRKRVAPQRSPLKMLQVQHRPQAARQHQDHHHQPLLSLLEKLLPTFSRIYRLSTPQQQVAAAPFRPVHPPRPHQPSRSLPPPSLPTPPPQHHHPAHRSQRLAVRTAENAPSPSRKDVPTQKAPKQRHAWAE